MHFKLRRASEPTGRTILGRAEGAAKTREKKAIALRPSLAALHHEVRGNNTVDAGRHASPNQATYSAPRNPQTRFSRSRALSRLVGLVLVTALAGLASAEPPVPQLPPDNMASGSRPSV